MQKYCIYLLLFFCAGTVAAQVNYTEIIQKSHPGQGKLTLHQSQDITDLVNGKTENAASKIDRKKTDVQPPQIALTGDTLRLGEDSLTGMDDSSLDSGARIRVNGYRIQLFSGDNTRKSKEEARQIGLRAKAIYSTLPVYISFISPHWVCRVGNFRTREEAAEYLQELRSLGRFSEAVLVKTKVLVRM